MTQGAMFKDLRYGAQIFQLFESHFDDWMDDSDREHWLLKLLSAIGVSLDDLDKQIHVGVENGYPADQQVRIALSLLAKRQGQPDGQVAGSDEVNQ